VDYHPSIHDMDRIQCSTTLQAVDEKKLKRPDTKSYKHVADGCADPLLEVKLHFILCVAKILQAFLQRFQTDKPTLSFLVCNQVNLLQDLLDRFIDRKTLDTRRPQQMSASSV